MMEENATCFIWGMPAEISPHPKKELMRIVDSPRAGGKYCALFNMWLSNLDDATKVRITSWLVKQRSLGIKCPELKDEIIHDENYAQPPSVYERADELLRFFNLKSAFIGQQVIFNPQDSAGNEYANYLKMLAWSGSIHSLELDRLLNYLKRRGWIELEAPLDGGGDATLTITGYARLEEMEKTVIHSSQAFVAMWFDPSMFRIYEKGIKPAIADSGYTAFRVDETNDDIGRIDDRIIAEIRRSRFIVADFTHDSEEGMRGNVYYEAGFARGLGKEVFSTCREDLIEKLPFDTRQYYHIAWEENNLEDLRENLADRI